MITFHATLACALLVALSTGAAAQTVYKCSDDGQTVYADHPCARGPSHVMPPPVGVDASLGSVRTGDSRTLLETEKLSATLRAARERNERRDERDRVRAARAGAALQRRCERLRLGVKWAREDLARTAAHGQDAARTRLRRRQEAMAVECRS
jgi:hypothetical protein